MPDVPAMVSAAIAREIAEVAASCTEGGPASTCSREAGALGPLRGHGIVPSSPAFPWLDATVRPDTTGPLRLMCSRARSRAYGCTVTGADYSMVRTPCMPRSFDVRANLCKPWICRHRNRNPINS